MATRTITPTEQVQNFREALWQREYDLQHRGIPAREILDLVRSEIVLYDLEQRVARGEVQAVEVHQCDILCEQPCPEWED